MLPVTSNIDGIMKLNTNIGSLSFGNENTSVVGLNEYYGEKSYNTVYYNNTYESNNEGSIFVVVGVSSIGNEEISFGIEEFRVSIKKGE